MTVTEPHTDDLGETSIDLVMRKARDQFLLQEFPGEPTFASTTQSEPETGDPMVESEQQTHEPAEPVSTPKFSIKAQFAALQTSHKQTLPTDIPGLVQAIDEQEETGLSLIEQESAIDHLQAQLFGLGILEPLLDIDGITDIFVNGPHDIWYEAHGRLHPSQVTFVAEPDVRSFATRLIQSAGGRLDEAYPSADIQNEHGQRIHAMLPPLSRGGTVLSIRLQPAHRASLAELHQGGMFTAEIETVLRYIVQKKANFLVSGGTGTGKTTLLNAMLSECAQDERIITIEDSAELAPAHPHVVTLQSKIANAEGKGEVALTELIRQALRMRPSRLVLGECRGREVADMLTAMNTGHSGTGTTVHANSAGAVSARLMAMGAMAGMMPETLTLQALTALEFVIHISRKDGGRFISEIGVLKPEGKTFSVEPLCGWEQGRRSSYLRWTDAGQLLLEVAQRSGVGRGRGYEDNYSAQ